MASVFVNRDRGADQQAGALLLELREGGSPARLVHSIPAWNDGLREDEQRVGMGQRNLLDRPLLHLQPGVNVVVSWLLRRSWC